MATALVGLGPDQRVFGVADQVLENIDEVLLSGVVILVPDVRGIDGFHADTLSHIVVVLDGKGEPGHRFGAFRINVGNLQESNAVTLVCQCLIYAVRKELTQHKLLVVRDIAFAVRDEFEFVLPGKNRIGDLLLREVQPNGGEVTVLLFPTIFASSSNLQIIFARR